MHLTLLMPLISFLVLPIGWLEYRLLSRTRHGAWLAPVVLVMLYGPWVGAACISTTGIRMDLNVVAGLLTCIAASGLWMKAGPPILRTDARLTTFPEQIVTDGIYRWVRHPLYLGHVLFIGAIVLIVGAEKIFLEIPLLWLIAYIVARYEETTRLEPRFGEAFRIYKTQTAMLMPIWGWMLWGLWYIYVLVGTL